MPQPEAAKDGAWFPQRIVSLQPSVTVVLERLGVLDRLVACTKYCAATCPQVAGRNLIVHDSWSSRTSEILAARPDLVIASVPYREESLKEILKSSVPVLTLAPKSLRDIYGDIALIAGAAGVAERAPAVIEAMQAEIESVRRRTEGLPRPRVFA
ncbi:MAG TPA: ABC transporter substrate-binding protein, partial [Terriglobales bacterium]|nr:ABC transporter substrate-binding protein [Terriglobales bacterium]